MPADYGSIANDEERLRRTTSNSIRILANLYSDRAHFVHEILQNAEDALRRRPVDWHGKRSVAFDLRKDQLIIRHYGTSFSESDVRAICSVAESQKELTDIGRFGIGFKSVYAFTDRPEVHSGDESFAIEDFVRPVSVPSVLQDPDATEIVLPLRNPEDRAEILTALQRLGPSTLLFLRFIEEIEWNVEDGPYGLYLRSQHQLADSIRQITVVGEAMGLPAVEERWIVLSKSASTPKGVGAGHHVEVAFSIADADKSSQESLQPVPRSPLVVFFPTAKETHLGFLIQGPYRTTPSRDNVPELDVWNQHCVLTTAILLRDALVWLRDNEYLRVEALRCLPLDRTRFSGTMFAPIYEIVRESLATQALLPRHGGGHVPAKNARLARTHELRKLLTSAQLTTLFGTQPQLSWLNEDISHDRTPELRDYLIKELKVEEIRPETLLPKLTAEFLEAQPDEWIRDLYEFLHEQNALHSRLRELPLVRLDDGSHVRPQTNGRPEAFLPGAIATGFPTVRQAVCSSEESRAFLEILGLTEPDLVDDIIVNVLPRYSGDAIPDVRNYTADINRILTAYRTDSASRRSRLVAALRETRFVLCQEQHDRVRRMATPAQVYLATDRLTQLFAGVESVLIVDEGLACLKGEDVRELLEACEAVRYLRPKEDSSMNYDWEERRRLREQAGHAESSGYNDRVTDRTLVGLSKLLEQLASLDPASRRRKATLLWEELGQLEERRGKGLFTAVYTWTHRGSYEAKFDAAFVRVLNETAWVSDADGNLCRPNLVLFDSLGWKPDPFLASKIRFKPPLIDQLAREAGFEPGVLDLLKRRGITSAAQLRKLLDVEDEPLGEHGPPRNVGDALRQLLGDAPDPTPPVSDPANTDPTRASVESSGESGVGVSDGSSPGAAAHNSVNGETPRLPAKGQNMLTTATAPPFISYIGVHPTETDSDPDGLDHEARMALEENAIAVILAREPKWHRTPIHNPGFDLFEPGRDGEPNLWCEVKAMTGRLTERPVGLSHTQFDCAREHGAAYWLYVVEHADSKMARIIRIQDPAGKARTFTFDKGWLAVAGLVP